MNGDLDRPNLSEMCHGEGNEEIAESGVLNSSAGDNNNKKGAESPRHFLKVAFEEKIKQKIREEREKHKRNAQFKKVSISNLNSKTLITKILNTPE